MKEIKAVIQPFKVEAVIAALHAIGNLPSVVVSAAEAVDVQHEFHTHVPKSKIELMVPDVMVEQVVSAIAAAAQLLL